MGEVNGQDVHMEHVSMRYPGAARYAVKDIDVLIDAGVFFSFLGPSGCGKTTILKLISGFMEPSEGRVRIGGGDMRHIGPNKRPTAMIFQNLALFPLMSVGDNIAFGLEVRGVGKAERLKRADELLELVDMPGWAKKRVDDLSGGQKQRVAIARGLAVAPAVLLLDEPLSALDLKLRRHMRAELRTIQRRTGVTFIYITHDQGEALTMSDRVGVLSDTGRLLQVAPPDELYNAPRTAFVADFVGENNAFLTIVHETNGRCAAAAWHGGLIRGRNPQKIAPGKTAVAFVRPEAISIGTSHNVQNNVVRCVLENLSFEGAYITLHLKSGDKTIVMRMNNDGVSRLPEVHSEMNIRFPVESTLFLPHDDVPDA